LKREPSWCTLDRLKKGSFRKCQEKQKSEKGGNFYAIPIFEKIDFIFLM